MRTRIKEEREKRKIKQMDLANDLNVAKSTLATYENTDRDPPLDILCQIADRFDISLDLLVRGKEKDRPTKEQSIKEMLAMYGQMTDAELELIRALITAALADRRYKESLNQDGQE